MLLLDKTVGFFQTLAPKTLLILLMVCSSIVPAQAGQITTATLAQSAQTELTRQYVDTVLAQQTVREQLSASGVSPAMLESRLQAMTDDEIAQLAANFDQAPAGAGALEILAIAFITLMVTDALGVTDVFTFIRPIR